MSAPDLLPKEEEWFDLLSVEKKLVGYTLGAGFGLLVILVWVSHRLL